LSRAELGWYQRCAQVSFTAKVLRAVMAWPLREGVAPPVEHDRVRAEAVPFGAHSHADLLDGGELAGAAGEGDDAVGVTVVRFGGVVPHRQVCTG
jgi:hypothetical protein